MSPPCVIAIGGAAMRHYLKAGRMVFLVPAARVDEVVMRIPECVIIGTGEYHESELRTERQRQLRIKAGRLIKVFGSQDFLGLDDFALYRDLRLLFKMEGETWWLNLCAAVVKFSLFVLSLIFGVWVVMAYRILAYC